MKLNFTKKQYKYLVEMCLLGAYVIEQSGVSVSDQYTELLKYILFVNDETSLKINEEVLDGIQEVAATLVESTNFNEDFLSNYNERNFWKELALRMASRDALEQLGHDVTEENFSEYIKLKDKYEKKYIEKFDLSKYNNKELPY